MKTKTLVMLLAVGVAIASLSAPSNARRKSDDDVGDNRATRPSKRRRKPTTRKKSRFMRTHEQMVKVCRLNEKQQLRIVELNARRDEAIKKYRAENAEKIKTLRAKITEANKNKDKQARKKAYTEIRGIRLLKKKIDAEWQKQIMAVLTPGQRVKWDQHQAMLSVMKRFKNVKFTGAQKAKVKIACAKFTKGVKLSDKKARRKAIKKLAKHIRKEILTDAQRAATTRPSRKSTTRPARKSTTRPGYSKKLPKVKKPA